MACPKLKDIVDKFDGFTQNPAKFLAVQHDSKDDIKKLVKSLYDFTKGQEEGKKKEKKTALPELVVQDFDEEQIWQELELQNNECWDQLVWEVANCMSLSNELQFPVETGPKPVSQSVSHDDESMEEEPSEKIPKKSKKDKKSKKQKEQVEDEEILQIAKKTDKVKSKTKKSSIVDDNFFKLDEMEQFLLREEKTEGKKVSKDSDEESIDLFDDIDEDDEDEDGERNMMYYDFFDQENCQPRPGDNEENYENDSNDDGDSMREDEDGDSMREDDDGPDDSLREDGEDDGLEDIQDEEQSMENGHAEDKTSKKKDKKVRFAEPASSEDESEDDSDVNDTVMEKPEKKSQFELRQERLKQQIEKLEQKTLNEAPWQLKGEVDAGKRPQNSLLEEVVDFDLTSRPAPIITEQTTFTLEDIIRQRIKDKAWDDVVRKEKPVDDQLNFRKQEILDHSKSKLSLAQVYEAEYLKQKQLMSGDAPEEKEPESHTQVRDAMNQLFSTLDTLCHYHYTPKAPQPEVKIVTNTPSISMEEVAPVATSDATLLAPEEIKKKLRGELMSKEERTETDKKRERRHKKKHQKAKGQVAKVTEHRNTTKGQEANDKSLKTSKSFFQQLNDDTTSLIKSNKNKGNVKNLKVKAK